MAAVAVRTASVIWPGVSVLSILSVSSVLIDFRVFSVDFRRCMEVMFCFKCQKQLTIPEEGIEMRNPSSGKKAYNSILYEEIEGNGKRLAIP